MFYREKLDLGMTHQEVIEILGNPDGIEKGEVSEEWRWENLVERDGKEYRAQVSFTRGVATSFCFSTPNAPSLELVISI